METNTISLETNIIPKKFLIPYKMLGVVFAVIALFNLLIALANVFNRHFFVLAAAYAMYIGLSAILAYGFWKMRKWLVPILGGMTFFLLIIDITHFIEGAKNVTQMIVSLAVICALLLFTYFTRHFLSDNYKNYKILSLFAFLLILSQVAITYFYKII